MVTVQLRFILTLFLALIACCLCQSDSFSIASSWPKPQISPDTLSSMKYGNSLIGIYEHVNNKLSTTTSADKKYFYSPIALLDHTTAVSTYNRVTKQPEMRFRIEMWNDKVENEVVEHLNEILGYEIKSNKVRVIPLERVILTSNVPTTDYSLPSVWTPYDKRLSVSCYEQKICDELADEMRSKPEHFDNLQLLYSLFSQTSQTKQTTISIDSVISCQMFANILHRFGDKTEVFLTANDEKKMLTEMATNIRLDTFDDSEVGFPDTDIQIFNILKDLMAVTRTTIKEENDKMWDSVLWNEKNYRPDKTTKTLNEIINKLDRETQNDLVDMFKSEKNQRNYELNMRNWVEVDRISSAISEKMAKESNSSLNVKILKEDVAKLLQESKSHVQWDGDKFVPKPMQLSKIDLRKFRDSQRDSQFFRDRLVHVRYTNAELSTPLKFVEHEKWTVTDEWSQLKEELKGTMFELQKTKTELTETRVYVNYLSTKLNATEKDLAEMKVNARNFATEFKVNSQRLDHEIKVSEDNLRKGLRETSNNFETITTNLNATRTDLSSTKSNIADLGIKLNARTSEIVDIGKMPTSCADLQRMGHKLSGFFFVKGSKMEVVYCDFYLNQNDKQKLIGYADVKSVPVHFHAQRIGNYDAINTVVPYNLMRMNVGGEFNPSTGVFVAPKPGKYYFAFSGLGWESAVKVQLQMKSGSADWIKIGETHALGWNTMALHSTLQLAQADQVRSFHLLGIIHDRDGNNFSNFIGWLLEEDVFGY